MIELPTMPNPQSSIVNRQSSIALLRSHVAALAGPRHPVTAPKALLAAEDYVAAQLASLGYQVERPAFTFRATEYRNVVGTKLGRDLARPRVLVGAHFDTVPATPGADDNASGVAAMLEAARLLANREFNATLEMVGFNLEEPQGITYRVGSRALAQKARREGVRYGGVLVLEMVGYTDPRPGSQQVPGLLFWKRVPRTGCFLAATGDGRSAPMLRTFSAAASRAAPELPVVTFRSPFSGWLVAQTRLSDNASYWDCGYPALMLTDTAFLRNPHYHLPSDRQETLDFSFMAQVVDVVVEMVNALAVGR